MPSDSDKTANHEMCSSSDHGCFHCVRFAGIRGFTAAFPGESVTAIQRRTDRDRKRFDPASCEESACYSAEVRTVSAARRSRVSALRGRCHPRPKLLHHRNIVYCMDRLPILLSVRAQLSCIHLRESSTNPSSYESLRRGSIRCALRSERRLEAGAGIEPANSGFADRDLTTWLPRHLCEK